MVIRPPAFHYLVRSLLRHVSPLFPGSQATPRSFPLLSQRKRGRSLPRRRRPIFASTKRGLTFTSLPPLIKTWGKAIILNDDKARSTIKYLGHHADGLTPLSTDNPSSGRKEQGWEGWLRPWRPGRKQRFRGVPAIEVLPGWAVQEYLPPHDPVDSGNYPLAWSRELIVA